MQTTSFLLLCCLAASSAAQSARPAWELTVDERIATRAAHVTQSGAGPELRIDGATHPELFLPHELIGSILHGVAADPARRQRVRDSYSDRLAAFGWTETEFWRQVEELAAPDVAAAHLPSDVRECQRRGRVLRGLRSIYGAARIDRFLYTAVAPRLSATIANPADGPTLRNREAGCR